MHFIKLLFLEIDKLAVPFIALVAILGNTNFANNVQTLFLTGPIRKAKLAEAHKAEAEAEKTRAEAEKIKAEATNLLADAECKLATSRKTSAEVICLLADSAIKQSNSKA